MSRWRQLERERAVIDRLRKLDSYRAEVVRTLGHELRNPLFSMSANLELLEYELEGEQREAAASALRSSRRMRRLAHHEHRNDRGCEQGCHAAERE